MNTSTRPSAADFHLKRLRPLVGGTITNLARTGVDEYGDEFFGLVIALPDGQTRTLIFLADDEGNGPGSFQLDGQG
ncbi:MAG: hypothetical protein J5W83_10490 [Candidatus Accumulibacter sp.]|uniref:hypothetical protein n=1 Tax=Accumulibacter sp. TaxID=2053492 RepID=UPI001B2776AF|nr:hypothetical protein [Accumulibacter sp.]MBO3702951.1 hypothetical protein [Accumulibacter sp.]